MAARRPDHRPPDTDDAARAARPDSGPAGPGRADPAGTGTAGTGTAVADSGERVGDVLDQVREHALRLLDEVPKPPTALRVQAGEVTVDVQWDGGPAPVAAPAPAAAESPAEPASEPEPKGDAAYVTAPTVGVFYRAPEPGAEPFTDVGAAVTAGQQVGIVEAMKLMIPVEAEQAGRITRVIKENGASVEYGEQLFGLDPAGAGGGSREEAGHDVP
jgi:acetyl-CoA carboxylase biotin carboxyl carrier protein